VDAGFRQKQKSTITIPPAKSLNIPRTDIDAERAALLFDEIGGTTIWLLLRSLKPPAYGLSKARSTDMLNKINQVMMGCETE